VPWFVWLAIAALALAGELAGNAFILVYIGVAAALTAVLAALGLPFLLQLVVFIPLTAALLTLVRPRTLERLGNNKPRLQLTGHSRLVDRQAVVEQEVSDDGGMVQLGAGEFWSARAYPPGVTIAKGSTVRIMFVHGLVLHVSLPTESGHLPALPTGDEIQAREEPPQ
jgi:membrane protein implicated in regulation of membrane protease activity